jgi:hypothetical protein
VKNNLGKVAFWCVGQEVACLKIWEENALTLIEIIDTFTFYGLDVILLAAATCAIVQVLKLTLLKKCKKKILTFLPFIVGTILYAAYSAISHFDAGYVLTNYTQVVEHGFAVGALSTVIYVWYEQFIRETKETSFAESVISTLIDGYVPTDAVESTAQAIAEAIQKDVTGDGAKKAAEILNANSLEDITERDVTLLSKLIIETLAHITTTN